MNKYKSTYDINRYGVMLPSNYTDKKTGKDMHISDIEKYYVSEKLDGQRALWNGKELMTRPQRKGKSRPILIPKWFKKLLPPGQALDGELFMGRDSFEETGFLRAKTVDNKKWKIVKYYVYDIPEFDTPFNKRYTKLKNIIKKQCKKWSAIKKEYSIDKSCPLIPLKQTIIKKKSNIKKILDKLISKKAEGIMIRDPTAYYTPSQGPGFNKRSVTILKFKPEFDMEGSIVGYEPGKGKYTGLLGAFIVHPIEKGKANSKKEFKLSGMTDTIRNNYRKTHPIGTIITFKYNSLTKRGIPRFAKYFRKRMDI